MKKTILPLLLILVIQPCFSQDHSESDGDLILPYQKIPDYPMDYNPGNILSRLVDGLGYRYYWASEGLTAKDLEYKPSEDARNTRETLEHIYSLSSAILNATENEPNVRPEGEADFTLATLREMTLNNLELASNAYANKSAEEISQMKVIFKSGEKVFEFPFWNMINGQISDAIYHTGQIVSFRRASGNPVNPKVNVFLGETAN